MAESPSSPSEILSTIQSSVQTVAIALRVDTHVALRYRDAVIFAAPTSSRRRTFAATGVVCAFAFSASYFPGD